MEFAKAVNELLPADVDLYYFSLKDPLWEIRPEDTNDGGIFNEGEPIRLLKPGTYVFKCYVMPWTEYELGPECKYNGSNPIKVSLQLSYADIQSIVDMMNWAWDNDWFDHPITNPSETICTDLLKTRLPNFFNKVQPVAHEIFSANYPKSEQLDGFGVYKICCPIEIVEFAAYSRADYYTRDK